MMHMMLAVWHGREKVRTADSHDAGRFAGLGNKYGQLMLMMLAVWQGCGKIGRLARLGKKGKAADAHDAGGLAGSGKKVRAC